ncbi:MAG: hypothetical protein IKB07_08370 [Lachnospiraceae bacterium]|nr:hypothetical protein [Lachnospiraceae bacterium]
MTMTALDIVREYKSAKNRREQIKILADLNQCSRDHIREILLANGIPEWQLPGTPGRKGSKTSETFRERVEPSVEVKEILKEADRPTPQTEDLCEGFDEVPVEKDLPAEDELKASEKKLKIPFSVRVLCEKKITEINEIISKYETERKELEDFISY